MRLLRSAPLAVAVAALLALAAPGRAPSRSSRRRATRRSTRPARRPLPHGRHVAVPARQPTRAGPQLERRRPPAGSRSRSPTPGTPATTATQSFVGGVGWYRKDFTLPDAPPSALSWVVRFESVNYRSKVWLNGKPIGTNTRRLPAVRDPPAGRAAQARRRQPPRHPRRQPPPADRLPALGPVDRRASRPAAGGTTAACCARSTCARSTTSTSTRVVVRPDLPCATCAGDGRLPRRRCATTARAPRRVARQRRASARSASRSARATIGAKRFATLHASDHGRQARGCGRRPARTSTTRRCAVALGRRRCCSATRCKTGIRSIKVVGGHLFLNGAPAELPRRRRCTRTRDDRASRSTTRRATSSSRGSRSSARR